MSRSLMFCSLVFLLIGESLVSKSANEVEESKGFSDCQRQGEQMSGKHVTKKNNFITKYR